MYLLLIRHAIAEPLGDAAERDADRALTGEGKRRFREVARGLARIAAKPRALLTSPLVRARQTAEIAARAWGDLPVHEVDALIEGDWNAIRNALEPYGGDDTVALVGHETWISTVTARLLGSTVGRSFDYRKGGVALVEVEALDEPRGKLHWFMPPRVFRRL